MVDQCVQGEGLVQVNVQIKATQRRINIVDVLKPAEDYIELAENSCMCLYLLYLLYYKYFKLFWIHTSCSSASTQVNEDNKRNVIRWMVDPQYKKEQV